MKIADLVKLLDDGLYHSGEELGQKLGVSRTAIWKQLKKLEEVGIELESVKGQGYRLPGGMELLDPDIIRRQLSEEARAVIEDLVVLDQVESTSGYIRAFTEEQGVHGRICLAEFQSGGRGRRGRAWVSPYGRNLYLSIGWGYEGGAATLEGLSLVVGLGVRRAIVDLTANEAILLKWPNDLLINRAKVGGILMEMVGDPSDYCQVIIGVGLNIGMPESAGSAIDQEWSDLRVLGEISRNSLAASVISVLTPMLSRYAEIGFPPYREEWEKLDACRGQMVTLSTPTRSVMGISKGVSRTGALRLATEEGVREFNGGEVSLRAHR